MAVETAAGYQHTVPILRLDYPGAEIAIMAVSRWERGFRAHACAKEPWTIAWIEGMGPGEAMWDVGANVGPYALIAGKRGLNVVAFEPALPNYAPLVQNVSLNRLEERITSLPLALGATTDLATFAYRTCERGAAGHAFDGEGVYRGGKRQAVLRQQVLRFRADDLIYREPALSVPDHLKLDVDGAEEDVLKGATRLLADRRLRTMMIEIPRAAEQRIAEFLSRFGWRLADRYDEREGRPIVDIVYGLFLRQGE